MKNKFELRIGDKIIKNEKDLSSLNLNQREIKQAKLQLIKFVKVFNNRRHSNILLFDDFIY